MAFATGYNRCPDFSEKGEPGQIRYIRCSLKVLADCGLVGFPSVGKSTIISVLSNAKPKIASYHFTTLVPHLGVVDAGEGKSFVMADLPGIIEGAHLGYGLGLEFLKHIERCKVIVHVIDMAATEGRDPYNDYVVISNELKDYKMNLSKRPVIIVANKMDMPGAKENLETFKKKVNLDVIPISAIKKENLNELVYKISHLLEVTPSFSLFEENEFSDETVYSLKENKPLYNIIREDEHTFRVEGDGLYRIYQMTDFNVEAAIIRFARQLRFLGLDDKLREMGAVDGDTVKIYDYQFEYQNLLYDLRDHAQVFDKKTGDFVASDATIEKWIHGIGNLVLLEHSQNSSFSNSSVKEKLSKLNATLECSDERRKLFAGTLFAYNLAKRKLWLKKENDEYLDEIKNRINTFLEEPIVKSKNVINCNFIFSSDETKNFIFSSDETKDYGKTIDESFFKNNEPVSLIDILSRCEIVIPDFQREYAQGRDDKHSEFVREMFLNDIFRFLKDESKDKMELDFIYGRINDRNEFFPFDGQQRLTTLFLVYAELCREKGKYAELLSQKFRYADRPEAEAYCKSCLKNIENPTDSTNASVKGMRRMRNAIREKVQSFSLSEKEIEKLNSIVFYIPSDISLSTDVYWKMNSRGKRLTPLERFKSSWFGKGEEKQAKCIDAIAVKFFKDNNEKYEENFMALISIMFDGFSMIENKRSGKRERINFYEPDLIPSSAYVAFKALSNDGYVKILEKLFCAMGDVSFDLKRYQNNFIDACPAYTKKPQMNECPGKGRNEKSLLFSYLITAGESLSSDQMKDWMRFCANIIWNASEPESALELIFKLHTRANEIISYLASDDSGKDSAISQYAEEITKAQKLLSNEVKKEEIFRAESTAFADGRIDFLFFDGNWNEFTNRLNSFQTWFDENGVKKDYQVAVAKAYIKLSTLRWGQNYFFDASKDFWKTNVLAKANTDDNRCFVSRLLSATNKDDLNKIEIEEMDEFLFAIKTSLVENDWFIKWMVQQWDGAKYSLKWPNGHPCFHKYHCNNVIYWDAGGWFAEEENLIENKLNTRFFKIMHDRGVNIDDGYYSLIDADGNSIGTDFSTSYLVIWGEWYNGVNYTRFKYKDKTYYLISTGKIISSAEYYNNEWNKVGEERSIYYINDKQERDLKSEKELIDMISNIPAK